MDVYITSKKDFFLGMLAGVVLILFLLGAAGFYLYNKGRGIEQARDEARGSLLNDLRFDQERKLGVTCDQAGPSIEQVLRQEVDPLIAQLVGNPKWRGEGQTGTAKKLTQLRELARRCNEVRPYNPADTSLIKVPSDETLAAIAIIESILGRGIGSEACDEACMQGYYRLLKATREKAGLSLR